MKLELFDCPWCDEESGFEFSSTHIPASSFGPAWERPDRPAERMPTCPKCEFEYACIPDGDGGSGMFWILRKPGPDIY